MPVFSHVDVRVRDRERAEVFYQNLFGVLGANYERGRHFTTWSREMKGGLAGGEDSDEWFGITEDKAMVPGSTRIALHAPDRAAVDRTAKMLDQLGVAVERDEAEYGKHYYAIFFTDPDGNPLEVVCYERPKQFEN